ncbi:saccharopine dehydrogenase family protein [Agrococcus sp. DT81.2]|uniref:saccharopine dehydrogenase family protein n=1 Tax=Agrococcus sp. DT81.2 TaxID=3393414 RepID=UPI003CE4C904
MSGDRELDLALFGATGFVGRLVAEHLARAAPDGLRIGLAGRSEERLRAVRSELGPAAADWPTVVADSGDTASLRSLVERSRVVVSTVGPYQRHGLPLATACAEAGTDYADLTAEVLFVRELVERVHEPARASGARIVVSCGFDSVPSDLAVHLLHRRAMADGAGSLTDTTLRVRRLAGGLSGGTIETMRLQLDRARHDPSLRRILADPASLSGRAGEAAPGQRDVSRPFLDAETGEWDAPFVMAGYNARLVRRSDALLRAADGTGYGPRFRYREVVPTGHGIGGRMRAAGIAAAMAALVAAMATPGVRLVLDRLLPSPGDGPSEERRRSGSFTMETTTRTADGRRYRAEVKAQGDPGYAATSVMLGEAGLALAVEGGRCSQVGGVLTAAVAMGDVLVERLRRAGFALDVGPA